MAGTLLLAACASPLHAEEAPVFDSRGIPYAAIERAVPLGRIQAYNAAYNVLVAQLFHAQSLTPGRFVALRRDGVIVCFARVECVESPQVATLEHLRETSGSAPITIPAVGDEIILIPHAVRGSRKP